MLPIFPEGHIVPESGRRIDEMKPGTAYLALHSGVPVIPAYLCGTPETADIVKSLVTPSHARSSSAIPSTFPTSRPTARPIRPLRPRSTSGSRRLCSPCRNELSQSRNKRSASAPLGPPELAFPELDQLLARYPAHLQPRSRARVLGRCRRIQRVAVLAVSRCRRPAVLRSWPPGWRGRSELERIHRWLFLTTDTGLTPVPFRDNGERSLQQFQGCFWELTPWLPGLADSAAPPALEHLEAAFGGLAALHVRLACESRVGVSPGLEPRHVTVEHLIDGGFDTLEAAVARQATSPGEAAAAGRWLSLARSAAPRVGELLGRVSRSVLDLQPCLRDARPDHFLFEGGRLSGIVDFGAMGVDCVAGDLARLIGEWQGGDPAARAAAAEGVRADPPASARGDLAHQRLRIVGRSVDRRAMAPLVLPGRPPLRRPASRLARPRPRPAPPRTAGALHAHAHEPLSGE